MKINSALFLLLLSLSASGALCTARSCDSDNLDFCAEVSYFINLCSCAHDDFSSTPPISNLFDSFKKLVVEEKNSDDSSSLRSIAYSRRCTGDRPGYPDQASLPVQNRYFPLRL